MGESSITTPTPRTFSLMELKIGEAVTFSPKIPTWVHKTGGNVHIQYTCMQGARAYYADIKLQNRKE